MDNIENFSLGFFAGAGIVYLLKNKDCPTQNCPPPPCQCPIPPSGTTYITLSEGQRDGPLFVQKIYANRIDGLNFIDYPLININGTPITLTIGQSCSNGCTITMTLVQIIQIQTYIAIFRKQVDNTKACPVCLSEDTLIDTPNGSISIKSIYEDIQANPNKTIFVWSSNSQDKILTKIIKSTRTPVKDHQMIRLVFNDDTRLLASSDHPLANDKLIGDIIVSDIIDNKIVISTELVSYHGSYTYDILPEGKTGTYWANGIHLKSTINKI